MISSGTNGAPIGCKLLSICAGVIFFATCRNASNFFSGKSNTGAIYCRQHKSRYANYAIYTADSTIVDIPVMLSTAASTTNYAIYCR